MGRRVRLLLTRDLSEPVSMGPDADLPGVEIRAFEEVRGELLSGRLWKHLRQYRHVGVRTTLLELLPQPFKTALIARLLSRGSCWFEDEYGRREPVTWRRLSSLAMQFLRERIGSRRMLRRLRDEVLCHLKLPVGSFPVNMSGRPVYLRTDLSFRVRSGGSVAHTAGVLNHLEQFGRPPLFLTTDEMPTVNATIATDLIRPRSSWNSREGLASFAFNERMIAEAEQRLCRHVPAFIYQRYSLNNYSGVVLSRRFSVPLVLEYNGSEIWISRNWGRPLPCEQLSTEIEQLNLQAADLIVVVSDVMRDELVARGVSEQQILVNPNGVDIDRYHPELDGTSIRRELGWEQQTVVGFIGTFGSWHGAEALMESFGELLNREPQRRQNLRLLMIGDGDRMPAVREARHRLGMEPFSHLTGLVRQTEGPGCLAACDLLVAPHVPNPDGTRFFGSPTKLFEYMAMGRGIVASDLDQIGQVLSHDRTAWLVRPGDRRQLGEGIARLADDRLLRERLGQAARLQAMSNHSWQSHTQRILEALAARCGRQGGSRAA